MDVTHKTDDVLLRICWLFVLGGVIFGSLLFKMFW